VRLAEAVDLPCGARLPIVDLLLTAIAP